MNRNAFQGAKFRRDFGTIKKYGEGRYKFTHLKTVRERGLVIDEAFASTKGTKNEHKLDNNISRARAAVYELAACNPWDWFVTLTLDKERFDRHALGAWRRSFSQFIRDERKSGAGDIKYLLIPERHVDGAWHMHGFLDGLCPSALHAFSLEERLPYRIRERLAAGKSVYTWSRYAEKYGFSNFEPIENGEAAAKYITKYVTEDLARSVTECGAHTYYASQGLRRAEVIKCGDLASLPSAWDYEGEYVGVKWFTNADEAAAYFR